MAEHEDIDDQAIEESGFEEDGTPQEKAYRVERKRSRAALGLNSLVGKLVFGIIAGCLLVVLAYAMVVGEEETSHVETSNVTEFQDGATGSGFGAIAPAATPEPEDDGVDFSSIQDQLDTQRSALEERNASLQEQVQQLQNSLADLSGRAGSENSVIVADLSRALQEAQEQNAQMAQQMREEFTNQLKSLQAANEERMTQQEETLETLRRENLALQTEITTASNDAAQEAQDAEAERRRQAEREAELAERRRQQQEELQARVESEAVIYDSGANSDGAEPASGGPAGTLGQLNPRGQSRDSALRAFVTGGGGATPTEQATEIANPAYTVLQGTMIQASLENAVDSSLPGTVSAVVNYPVWSFDQSQVLIPSGSRLFGSYSSDIDIGQGRILIGWTRLVTPDGQSVQLSAFGGDQMGRSGISGRVDTRFGTRIGNAALISLVGAGPSIAAAQIDDDTTSDIARDVTEDLGDATSSAAAKYATLPPIITVEPGSAITVMVDRDLEFF
ncbi:type IV secretion system protein VirB10 [Salipiger thiooxidans]|uniref:Type IV secretion system protein VirB10 n=1 Tax=Salipiger thiooxidans TaxID=282683 RepID=A0A1G7MPN4_9RHOB|nr:TrbI/VirB10 family protein [Salipiger thiooxidans]SDF63059.1 type IV secretion system protein VirB10 [Salipiger thiooxidans]